MENTVKVIKTIKLIWSTYILYTIASQCTNNVYNNLTAFLAFDLIDIPYLVLKNELNVSVQVFLHHIFVLVVTRFLALTPSFGIPNIATLCLYRMSANIPIHVSNIKTYKVIAFFTQAYIPFLINLQNLDTIILHPHLLLLFLMEFTYSLGGIMLMYLYYRKMSQELSIHISYKIKKSDEYTMLQVF
jgi:hypothetical protein